MAARKPRDYRACQQFFFEHSEEARALKSVTDSLLVEGKITREFAADAIALLQTSTLPWASGGDVEATIKTSTSNVDINNLGDDWRIEVNGCVVHLGRCQLPLSCLLIHVKTGG
jgi:hypothetical protein